MVGGPPRGVLHTTETLRMDSIYPYYHIGFQDRGANGVRILQVRDFEKASRALRHPSGTPETNRQGTACINAVIIGYSRNSPDLSDQMVDALNLFFNWTYQYFGIPMENTARQGAGACYGETSPCRMTWPEWAAYSGWCGHQNVPANTHWDPGLVPWTRLLAPLGDDTMRMPPERRNDLQQLIAQRAISGDINYYYPNGAGTVSADLPDQEWMNLAIAAAAGVSRTQPTPDLSDYVRKGETVVVKGVT